MIRWALRLMALALFAGCAAATSEPPAGAAKYDSVAPATGSKFVYRITEHAGGSRDETWTVVPASYADRAVYGISTGTQLMIHDATTGSWIATLRDGRERFSASPDSGELQWPLWTGKSWFSSFTYHDLERGRSFRPVETWWKVTAYEEITVPGGRFTALRIDSTPGTNNATRLTTWFVPTPRIMVKRIFERTSDHYLGYGTSTTELVRYERP